MHNKGNGDSTGRENFFREQAEHMQGDDGSTWWENNDGAVDEMSYECDANLGSPLAVDCDQIEWSQLSSTSDTLALAADQVKFFHQSKEGSLPSALPPAPLLSPPSFLFCSICLPTY